MAFNEKLDFLMNITKTSNRALANFTALDASYISRLRNGKRRPSKNENYVAAMATYFARHLKEGYQRTALANAVKNGAPLPEDYKEVAGLIYEWLSDDNSTKSVAKFLHDLSHFQFKKDPPIVLENLIRIHQVPESNVLIYYGNEGKREAVIAFLSLVANEQFSQTIKLFSDEDMDWLTESPEFTAKWAALMSRVIMRGNKIKIIHTVSRDLDEMLAAINRWMPLYMTGAIQPYYYPRKRDGIFKRTLFIAPETAAVMSTSVGHITKAANFFIKDKQAVSALAGEFNNYLSLCKPLMGIYTNQNKHDYFKILSDFEKEKGAVILKTGSLSIISMPPEVATNVISRLEDADKEKLLECYRLRRERFEQNITDKKFWEIITLSDLKEIEKGSVKVALSEMFNGEEVFYTAHEYRAHLKNIVRLLNSCANYRVCLLNDKKVDGYMLYVKEDLGLMVAKTSAPPVILAMNEINITSSCWDFLRNTVSEDLESQLNKDNTVKKLEALINNIKI